MTYIIYMSLFLVFLLFLFLERAFPARPQPFEWRWFVRATTMNMVQLAILVAIGIWLNPWMAPYALVPWVGTLPPLIGGIAAAILASLFQYFWHRAAHANDFLWRTFHQLHHSPTRIDLLATDYTHPLDHIVFTVFNSVAAVGIFGLTDVGIAWSVFVYGVNNYYAHCNIRSPRWFGLLLQRPEMHRVHHRLDHHAQNYGLPMWDMMFGTFANPETADFPVGFSDGRELRVRDMLLGKDVHV
ncbi:sterol desaturase family protein [Luteibacter aegosomatis]|uniref:sterol desaturase family protein n=1 Tax=Luteibacter aegosomatis TaxID=2911537 RepID=UPI001FF8C083|nr:sterol desaturase family protein [Luteibacter aegosomatis]UPG85808.1 sterol desaturase family protein [Luteibacter aegosomatis]